MHFTDTDRHFTFIIGLTLYEMHRKPREITNEAEKKVLFSEVAPQLCCYLCEGPFVRPYAVMECLHRFCFDCVSKYLRIGRKDCPRCGTRLPSTRFMRPDPATELVISLICPSHQRPPKHFCAENLERRIPLIAEKHASGFVYRAHNDELDPFYVPSASLSSHRTSSSSSSTSGAKKKSSGAKTERGANAPKRGRPPKKNLDPSKVNDPASSSLPVKHEHGHSVKSEKGESLTLSKETPPVPAFIAPAPAVIKMAAKPPTLTPPPVNATPTATTSNISSNTTATSTSTTPTVPQTVVPAQASNTTPLSVTTNQSNHTTTASSNSSVSSTAATPSAGSSVANVPSSTAVATPQSATTAPSNATSAPNTTNSAPITANETSIAAKKTQQVESTSAPLPSPTEAPRKPVVSTSASTTNATHHTASPSAASSTAPTTTGSSVAVSSATTTHANAAPTTTTIRKPRRNAGDHVSLKLVPAVGDKTRSLERPFIIAPISATIDHLAGLLSTLLKDDSKWYLRTEATATKSLSPLSSSISLDQLLATTFTPSHKDLVLYFSKDS